MTPAAAVAAGAAATMTDPDAPAAELPRPKPRREPIRKPGPFPVIAGSLGLFLAITALLALQLRAGADPALGAGEPQLVAAAAPRRARSSSSAAARGS